jgi:hypothetical protein
MVITLSVASPSDANLTRTFVSLLNTDGVPNNEHNVSALEGIGMSLYGCLLLKANMKNKTIHSAYANEHSITDLEQLDDSPMRRFIHAVATGNEFEKAKGDTSRRAMDQREYNTTYAATDLIRTSKGETCRGSVPKSMISDMLMCSNASYFISKLPWSFV